MYNFCCSCYQALIRYIRCQSCLFNQKHGEIPRYPRYVPKIINEIIMGSGIGILGLRKRNDNLTVGANTEHDYYNIKRNYTYN